MNDRDDEETLRLVLMVTFCAIAIAVGTALSVAVRTTLERYAHANGPAAWETAPQSRGLTNLTARQIVDLPVSGAPVAVIYFELGRATLPPEADESLKKAIEAVGASKVALIVLSGFHDATGDPARNAELARQRAEAVREGLVARGFAVDRVVLRKPEETQGDGPPREARRVELRVVDPK